jgi:hypothetical protein
MTAAGIFARWQPRYAKHGVATFPVQIVDGDKKPAISGYVKTGLRGSGQLAIKFADAQSFGFMCGDRNRVMVVDMDDRDPAIVKEGERLFGASPLLWRTGGGKFAMAFRHNGEPRRIRPIPSVPIDLLGGGFTVAPPSVGVTRPYEIIRGTLADLDRLPTARIPVEVARKLSSQAADRIPDGRRHAALFKHCRSIVGYCGTLDQLIDATTTWAGDRLDPIPPIPHADIIKTCVSVWNYREGRRKIMHGVVVESAQFQALAIEPVVLGVLAFLVAENGPDSEFMIADGLTKKMGWRRRLLPAARARFIELGLIERIDRRDKTGALLYRWREVRP